MFLEPPCALKMMLAASLDMFLLTPLYFEGAAYREPGYERHAAARGHRRRVAVVLPGIGFPKTDARFCFVFLILVLIDQILIDSVIEMTYNALENRPCRFIFTIFWAFNIPYLTVYDELAEVF